MATSKSKSTRKLSTLTKDQLKAFGLAHVSIYTNDGGEGELNQLIHVPLAANFKFGWQFDSEYGTEFAQAEFSGPELFKIAYTHGLLTETVSTMRRLPAGKLPAYIPERSSNLTADGPDYLDEVDLTVPAKKQKRRR